MTITIQGMLGDERIEVAPLFPDTESRDAFLKRYDDDVPPKLRECEKAHARSYHDFMFKILK